MKKGVIIVGSSRVDGDTQKLANELSDALKFDVVSLSSYHISHYDYEHRNATDDFLQLIRHLINQYDTFVFATPVYWYAMSGVMKVFFDRINDLLEIDIVLGRRLRGKRMAVVTCSIGNNLGENFWLPFMETASYLGMTYAGSLHTIPNRTERSALEAFSKSVFDHTNSLRSRF